MKKYLDIRYDVTDLTDDEIGQLCLEAVEAAQRRPAVEVEHDLVVHEDENEFDLAADES